MGDDIRLHVRPFQAEDQQKAKRLILEGLGEHFGFIDEALNPDLDDIQGAYITPGHVFLVALLERELVGTGALISPREGVGRIVRVTVHPAERRRGIGRLIVERLLLTARQRGYTDILVETNSDWHDAIGLYRRFGFSPHPDRNEEGLRMQLELT